VFLASAHEGICSTCDSARTASVHRVPETPDAASEIDARKLGESE
jgi:hypothetical protein